MNKTTLAIIGITSSFFTLHSAFAEPGYWLMGISGGYAERRSNVAVNLLYQNPAPALSGMPATFLIQDYEDSGPLWGILVGYQAQCENWILGGEISADWGSFAEDHPFAFSDFDAMSGGFGLGWSGSFRYKRDVTIAFTARMGYVLESLRYFVPPIFIPYVRAGFEVSKDTLQATYFGDPNVFPFSSSSQQSSWPYRFIAGVGVEFPVIDTNISIRFEYDYHTSGQTIETQSTIFGNPALVTPNFITAMDPVTNSGKISFVWNFY
ncbi:MAG: outer membrane protein [Candidatus Berkiellales bacterium]